MASGEPRRIVVLISGSGTNLQALIDAANTASLPNSKIVLVLSNRKSAYGLTRAQSADPPIPTAYLALQQYLKTNIGKTRDDYDFEVANIVLAASPQLIVLAGWMHVLGDRFLKEVVEKQGIEVINLHPALPGAFDGVNAIERAYYAFQRGEVRNTGVMVHKVVREVDRGKPVLVREVEIKEEDSLSDLEQRIHETEWAILVEAARTVLNAI